MKLDIVTPQRRLRSVSDEAVRLPCDITSVTLPAEAGQMEVLPGHAPKLVLLGTGVMRFHAGGPPVELMVSGGFAEIDHDQVTVMTQAAALGEEIDRASEERALTSYQKELSALGPVAHDDERFKHLQAETKRAAAKLTLVK